jgi:hypothetical protein
VQAFAVSRHSVRLTLWISLGPDGPKNAPYVHQLEFCGGLTLKNTLKLLSMSALVLAAAAIPASAGVAARVPEPVSILLLASGIGGVALVRRLRK